jgi:hypothetical protein
VATHRRGLSEEPQPGAARAGYLRLAHRGGRGDRAGSAVVPHRYHGSLPRHPKVRGCLGDGVIRGPTLRVISARAARSAPPGMRSGRILRPTLVPSPPAPGSTTGTWHTPARTAGPPWQIADHHSAQAMDHHSASTMDHRPHTTGRPPGPVLNSLHRSDRLPLASLSSRAHATNPSSPTSANTTHYPVPYAASCRCSRWTAASIARPLTAPADALSLSDQHTRPHASSRRAGKRSLFGSTRPSVVGGL